MVHASAGATQLISSTQAFYVANFRGLHIVSGEWDTQDNDNLGQINKYDGLANTDGISFQAAAHQAIYQFTNPKPQVANLASVVSNNVTMDFWNMYVNFAADNNGVWSNYDLPTTYNFPQFNQTQNMGFEFTGGSFGVGITNVSSVVLPAPGSAALLGIGGIMARRRRR